MATRTITIVCHSAGDFDLHEGEHYVTRLCWDEMLGEIARLTLGTGPENARYGMGTPEKHQARADRMSAARDLRRADAPSPGAAALQTVIREFGCRAGPNDELLPMDQQPALVREAMQAAATTSQP